MSNRPPGAIADATDVTLASGQATIIIAADNARRGVIVVADPVNSVSIRVGASTVAAARGALLASGQPITIETTDPIYGYVGSSGQKVSMLILKD